MQLLKNHVEGALALAWLSERVEDGRKGLGYTFKFRS